MYDEGYGRVLVVTDPDGGQVQVDERQDDLHGYRRLDVAGADPAVSVRAALDTPDVARYRTFLEVLGLSDAVELHEQEPADLRATAPDGSRRRDRPSSGCCCATPGAPVSTPRPPATRSAGCCAPTATSGATSSPASCPSAARW